MPRAALADTHIHAAIRDEVLNWHADIVHNVQAASQSHPVLVVGMALNPFCLRARRALGRAGVVHQYLEYGGYFSQWKPRLALKMWCGWPSFPMVFVKGALVGGSAELKTLLASGELNRLLGE